MTIVIKKNGVFLKTSDWLSLRIWNVKIFPKKKSKTQQGQKDITSSQNSAKKIKVKLKQIVGLHHAFNGYIDHLHELIFDFRPISQLTKEAVSHLFVNSDILVVGSNEVGYHVVRGIRCWQILRSKFDCDDLIEVIHLNNHSQDDILRDVFYELIGESLINTRTRGCHENIINTYGLMRQEARFKNFIQMLFGCIPTKKTFATFIGFRIETTSDRKSRKRDLQTNCSVMKTEEAEGEQR